MRRLNALIRKEFLQMIHDPSSILIAVVLPLILMFIYGYGINLDNNTIKVGLVLEERTPEIVSLATSFTNSRFLVVKEGNDRREFIPELVAGKLRGIIVIPRYFSATIAQGLESAKVQVIADGSEPNTALFVQNYAQGVVNNWLIHRMEDQGIEPQGPMIDTVSRVWYNPELKSRNFLIPGSIALIITLIGTMLTALVVAREWERGTMEALMATPVTSTEIILGKLIPYFLLGLMSMTLCWCIAVLFYGVPFRGSFLALLMVTSLYLLCSLGLGLLISTISRDQFLASQLALTTAFLPAFMLSGFIFEIDSMPTPIQAFTYILPVRYFVTSLQTLFLAGNIWPLLLKCMGAMGIVGIIYFLLIAYKTSSRLDA